MRKISPLIVIIKKKTPSLAQSFFLSVTILGLNCHLPAEARTTKYSKNCAEMQSKFNAHTSRWPGTGEKAEFFEFENVHLQSNSTHYYCSSGKALLKYNKFPTVGTFLCEDVTIAEEKVSPGELIPEEYRSIYDCRKIRESGV